MTAPKPLPLREAAEALLKFLESCAAHPHEAGPSVFCIEADVLRTALAAPQSTLVTRLDERAKEEDMRAQAHRFNEDEILEANANGSADAYRHAAALAREAGHGLAWTVEVPTVGGWWICWEADNWPAISARWVEIRDGIPSVDAARSVDDAELWLPIGPSDGSVLWAGPLSLPKPEEG